jgi:ATP-dependent DNA helicase PIF1
MSTTKINLDELMGDPTPALEYESVDSTPTEFVTGQAGTGKTHTIKKKIEDDPSYGTLCATTGIAAINLGAITLNSALKYFDTDSLRDRFNRGGLTTTLHQLGRKTRNLIIDEVSMMDGLQLDYIKAAVDQVNKFEDMKGRPLGIILTGDFAQLPPVNAPWAFEAEAWPKFEANTTKLTKVWRQDNPEFLEAINAARTGDGGRAAEILKGLGVRFLPSTVKGFQGTTIMSKNAQVDNFNFSALLDVPGEFFGLGCAYWGQEDKNWRKHIPGQLKLKVGAYVMILNNDFIEGFVNGDCGWVEEVNQGVVRVRLVRNERVVNVGPIVRSNSISIEEGEKLGLKDPYGVPHVKCHNECALYDGVSRKWAWGSPSFNCQNGTWNVGGVKFYPLRAAYATTVHKSQGLTIDRAQIDIRDPFFGSPSMAYVALSRVRTPEGLTLVGSPETLASRVKVDEKVRRWL